MNAEELSVEVDNERIRNAAVYDGYYGISYSDASMSVEEVLSVHHSLGRSKSPSGYPSRFWRRVPASIGVSDASAAIS